jgi:hypothetical protein
VFTPRNASADDQPPTYSYSLASHLTYASRNTTTVALIKRTPTLDSVTPLATQLHVLNLFGGDETPYESLHAVVSNGVKPWFEAFVGARHGGKDGDSKMGESMRLDTTVLPGSDTSASKSATLPFQSIINGRLSTRVCL